jgi:molybdate transport system substrate-binding protein
MRYADHSSQLRRMVLHGMLALGLGAPFAVHGAEVLVFAAASLKPSLDRILAMPEVAALGGAKASYAASSQLAKQIEAGAPAALFVSADQDWMDYLAQRNAIQGATRRNLLGNRLALIAPANSTVQLEIKPGFPLVAALNGGRLVTGDPDSVPVGRYARSALMSLGVWNGVVDRLVRAEDVRTALVFVARGEAPLGIVYETDARIDKRVRLVGLFPGDTHPKITYPMALTTAALPDAARFAEYVRSDASRTVFERFGFIVLR